MGMVRRGLIQKNTKPLTLSKPLFPPVVFTANYRSSAEGLKLIFTESHYTILKLSPSDLYCQMFYSRKLPCYSENLSHLFSLTPKVENISFVMITIDLYNITCPTFIVE